MEMIIAAFSAAVVYVLLKKLIMNDLSKNEAGRMIKEGALIVDVRSEEEYLSAHLQRAVNIPLKDLGITIGRHLADRNGTVLLHCRSGSRSFIGKRILKGMKYHNVYNLGSFGRAKRMVNNEKAD